MAQGFQTAPSDALGEGVASFVNQFGNTLAERDKQQRQLQGQQALEKFKMDLEKQKEGAAQKRTETNVAGKVQAVKAKPNAGGKYSPADQHFFDAFSKARAAFLHMHQQYQNPDLIKDMNLSTKLKGKSSDEIDKIAEIDYAKGDPEGYDLISKPENIAHYKQLMGAGTTNPTPTSSAPPPPMPSFNTPPPTNEPVQVAPPPPPTEPAMGLPVTSQ